jgi:hypothetical protein
MRTLYLIGDAQEKVQEVEQNSVDVDELLAIISNRETCRPKSVDVLASLGVGVAPRAEFVC